MVRCALSHGSVSAGYAAMIHYNGARIDCQLCHDPCVAPDSSSSEVE
jgi:hypothetical protein